MVMEQTLQAEAKSAKEAKKNEEAAVKKALQDEKAQSLKDGAEELAKE